MYKLYSLSKLAVVNTFIWAFIFVVTFPLLWSVLTSLKRKSEIIGFPPSFLPENPTSINYQRLFTVTKFSVYLINSLIVASCTTVVVIIISTLGAYSLARFRYAGRGLVGQMILVTYLLPTVVLLIPIYVVLSGVGFSNSLAGLVIAYTTFTVPFALWLLRPFMASIPADIENAAMIDGASRMRAFFDVVLPQAIPGIIATALFTFLHCWNEYLYALVFINSDAKKTLPPGVISLLSDSRNIEWDLLMAASVVMAIPVMIFFSFLQRHLTTGFGAGAMKG